MAPKPWSASYSVVVCCGAIQQTWRRLSSAVLGLSSAVLGLSSVLWRTQNSQLAAVGGSGGGITATSRNTAVAAAPTPATSPTPTPISCSQWGQQQHAAARWPCLQHGFSLALVTIRGSTDSLETVNEPNQLGLWPDVRSSDGGGVSASVTV